MNSQQQSSVLSGSMKPAQSPAFKTIEGARSDPDQELYLQFLKFKRQRELEEGIPQKSKVIKN